MATSVIRRFWIDLNDMRVTTSLGDRNAIREINAKLHDSARWGIQFHRAGVPELLAASTSITFGVKAKGDYSGDFLASQTSWTAATTTNTVDFADTDFYYGTVSLNTAEMETAIGSDPGLECMAEFSINVSGSGMIQSTETITFNCQQDVIKDDEGDPTSADPTYPNASEVPRWKSGITSLTGGLSADLDSIATTSLTVPYAVQINNQDDSSDIWEIWILKAGTDAENAAGGIVRPDDYDGSTNAKVWYRQSSFPAVNDEDVAAAGSATNYTPSASTVEGHLAGIDTKLGTIGGAISNVVEDTTPQAGGDVDFNGFDAQFDDATGIRDDSDNEQLIFQKTASAVNYFEITNAATGTAPILSVAGSDTNVSLLLDAKGSGTVQLGADLDTNGNAVQFDDGTGIEDDSGNELLLFDKTASAVNYVEVGNSATGTGPDITAAGDDTNIDLLLASKGSGYVKANGSRVITTSGISGGQTITGGTASGNSLTLESTSNATKGGVIVAASNWLILPELSSAPSTPSSGFASLYINTSGKAIIKDDTGATTTLGSQSMYHNFYIGAENLWEATTSGAAAITKSETTTNKLNWKYFLFDQSTAESVWGSFVIPDDWDNTTNIKAKIHWKPYAGAGAVVWGVAGRGWDGAPGTALDSAVGTESTTTDTSTDSAPLTSPATSSITFAGSQAAGSRIYFRVRRVASDGADTLAADAEFHGISFQLKLTGTASAW